MIDVIIPAYNAHKTIDKTLFSIAYQSISKQINVYIVNDCSDNDYSKQINFFLDSFNSISELKTKSNLGPGKSRQYGIDNTSSKYIIFIDADDVFSSPYSCEYLYNTIIEDNYDLVISNFKEEINNGFYNHIFEEDWMHGKIYRRDFLNENNIHFNDNRIAEDVAFNNSIFLQNFNIGYLDICTYIWLNNKDSITRSKNKNYMSESLNPMLESCIFAVENSLKAKPNLEKISSFLYKNLLYFYFYYLEFEDYNFKDCFNKVREIIAYLDKYDLDDEIKRSITKSVFEELIEYSGFDIFKLIYPRITLKNLIKKIMDEGEFI